MLLINRDRTFQIVARPPRIINVDKDKELGTLRPKHTVWSSIKRYDHWCEEWAGELDEIETTLMHVLYEVSLDRHLHLLMKRQDFCDDLRKLVYRVSSNSRRKREL